MRAGCRRHWRGAGHPSAAARQDRQRRRARPVRANVAARIQRFNDDANRSVVAMTFHHSIADGWSRGAVLLEVLRRATIDRSPPAYRPARPSS
jgi:hypothetical protein